MGQSSSNLITKGGWWLLLPLFVIFSFYFPRFLVATFGETNPWTNFFYLYGFGFFYTGSGVLLALKTKACNLTRQLDRFWLKITIGGYFYFALLHAVWIYLALSIPYLGGQ